MINWWSIKLLFLIDRIYIELISACRKEPRWMLDWRINSFYCWIFICFPSWSKIGLNYKEFNKDLVNMDTNYMEVTNRHVPDIDVIYNSNSVYLSLTKELKKIGVQFMNLSIATLLSPVYIRRYFGKVISSNDNYFSALNSMFFTDGTFVVIPKNVRSPVLLSTYFKINRRSSGQFERTLIILEDQSHASYFEGCNSNIVSDNVLHAAVVEITVRNSSCLRYSTFQNWLGGEMGVLNFVTKRALCSERYSKIIWIQIEIGAVITWKYPSSVLIAKYSNAEFYSLSISNSKQCVDTGTKVYHIGSNTNSIVLSKSVAYGLSTNVFRIYVNIGQENCKSVVKCNSLLWSRQCMVCSLPTIEVNCLSSNVEYESVNSYITKMQLNYCKCKGLSGNDTLRLIINGHVYDILRYLPIEISLEVTKLFFENNN
ncbi:FeS cluster assembly protein sufB [Candidatus Hodgkinia cicadicola]|nr:MAG: FeS cluster assembly protein sufB [Candidatus Hodgkinia cicadicola]PIM96733.1 FeS cluster assembly protein sufB [Candidatus Hodgkinia cicadicola]